MKVVLICSNYEPGGAQKAMFKLMNEFRQRDINAECLFFYNKGDYLFDGKPVILYEKNKITIINIWVILFRLYKYLKREKPDAIITFLPFGNLIGCLISLFAGVNIRVASHRNEANREMSLFIRYLDFIFAWLKIYTQITAVSNSTKKSFQYYTRNDYERIITIPNGVDYNPSQKTKLESRKRLNLTPDAFLIGNIGRLVEQKNHKLLIDILPELPEIKLVIVGKGILKDTLKLKAKSNGSLKRLIIIEELNSDEIADFLNAIDLFIMPSLFEGMSNALIEALAAGKPIIASDVPSQRDVLSYEESNIEAGILLPINNQDAWIQKIQEIKENAVLRNMLIKNSKNRAENFTVRRMADGFLTAIKNNI
jgi:glycosyltransferase involved in cell wall biosynthesis